MRISNEATKNLDCFDGGPLCCGLIRFHVILLRAEESLSKCYSKIQVGDSEQAVVELYGEPTEITDCSAY